MFLKIIRAFIGILFIPIAIGVGEAFYTQISEISVSSGILHILERGALIYLAFHVMIYRPRYLYILGHEFVHVLATWLCGGKVVSFNVGPSGGNVITTKTNFFVELSPYFIPIYTILLGPIFLLLEASDSNTPFTSALFIALLGATLAFHFTIASEALRIKQPDIVKSGLIFSLVIIFAVNLVITMAVFCLLFRHLSFLNFVKDSLANSIGVYYLLYEKITNI